MSLIRSKRQQLAEYNKIPEKDLRWYASFHNESHHPHVHLVVYSADPKKGFLTEKGIEKLRSEFAREIFKNDLLHIYKEQTKLRGEINEQTEMTLQTMIENMRSGVEINKQLESDLLLLAERLKNTSGKKVYGYLKADVKAVVDKIIDELAKTEAVANCYAAWYEMKCEILRNYIDKMPEPLPLSQQKELSKIRQTVIDEALRIANGEVTFEQDKASFDADEQSDTEPPVEESEPSAQGNIYAKYFLENMNKHDPFVTQSMFRLFHHASRIFEDSIIDMKQKGRTDRKAKSKERQKKIALGHAPDDYAPEQVQ